MLTFFKHFILTDLLSQNGLTNFTVFDNGSLCDSPCYFPGLDSRNTKIFLKMPQNNIL